MFYLMVQNNNSIKFIELIFIVQIPKLLVVCTKDICEAKNLTFVF